MAAREPSFPGGEVSMDFAQAYHQIRDGHRVPYMNADGVKVWLSKEAFDLLTRSGDGTTPMAIRVTNSVGRSEPGVPPKQPG